MIEVEWVVSEPERFARLGRAWTVVEDVEPEEGRTWAIDRPRFDGTGDDCAYSAQRGRV